MVDFCVKFQHFLTFICCVESHIYCFKISSAVINQMISADLLLETAQCSVKQDKLKSQFWCDDVSQKQDVGQSDRLVLVSVICRDQEGFSCFRLALQPEHNLSFLLSAGTSAWVVFSSFSCFRNHQWACSCSSAGIHEGLVLLSLCLHRNTQHEL